MIQFAVQNSVNSRNAWIYSEFMNISEENSMSKYFIVYIPWTIYSNIVYFEFDETMNSLHIRIEWTKQIAKYLIYNRFDLIGLWEKCIFIHTSFQVWWRRRLQTMVLSNSKHYEHDVKQVRMNRLQWNTRHAVDVHA